MSQIHKFSVPYEFEGETYTELEYDFSGLKGSDIAEIKKAWAGAGNYSPLPTTDSDFCARILAKVCKKPLEFFEDMPAKDYCQLTQAVTNFLIS